MNISLIVAVANNGVIGQHNGLPWRLPDDLRRFKVLTMGKPIIMGRKTYDSIGKALPGRTNIVITRQADLRLPGCTVVNSLASACNSVVADELMVIGGADIYRQALPLARRIYLTQVHADVEGDAYFPVLDEAWHESMREACPADERHAHAYSFITLERMRQ
ncbi:MAG: dihydrofolate reductase [Steroidobacteraceae bacterium]